MTITEAPVSISSTAAILGKLQSQSAKDADGVERREVMGRACAPSLSNYGAWGSVISSPSGLPANLVHNEDLKTHLVIL